MLKLNIPLTCIVACVLLLGSETTGNAQSTDSRTAPTRCDLQYNRDNTENLYLRELCYDAAGDDDNVVATYVTLIGTMAGQSEYSAAYLTAGTLATKAYLRLGKNSGALEAVKVAAGVDSSNHGTRMRRAIDVITANGFKPEFVALFRELDQIEINEQLRTQMRVEQARKQQIAAVKRQAEVQARAAHEAAVEDDRARKSQLDLDSQEKHVALTPQRTSKRIQTVSPMNSQKPRDSGRRYSENQKENKQKSAGPIVASTASNGVVVPKNYKGVVRQSGRYCFYNHEDFHDARFAVSVEDLEHKLQKAYLLELGSVVIGVVANGWEQSQELRVLSGVNSGRTCWTDIRDEIFEINYRDSPN